MRPGSVSCFSDLERSLGIATWRCPPSLSAWPSFSDLERSLGIATWDAEFVRALHLGFSDLERSLGIATRGIIARFAVKVKFQ